MIETFQELLFKLKAYDDGLIEFDADQMFVDMKTLADNFDSKMRIKLRLKSQALMIEDQIEELKDALEVIRNNEKRLDERIKYLMEASGTEIIKGELYQVLAFKKKEVELSLPDQVTTTHEFDYPEFVRKKIELSWDKNAIKEAVKMHPEEYAAFGKKIDKTCLKFGVKK